jgi:hypothetical protein
LIQVRGRTGQDDVQYSKHFVEKLDSSGNLSERKISETVRVTTNKAIKQELNDASIYVKAGHKGVDRNDYAQDKQGPVHYPNECKNSSFYSQNQGHNSLHSTPSLSHGSSEENFEAETEDKRDVACEYGSAARDDHDTTMSEAEDNRTEEIEPMDLDPKQSDTKFAPYPHQVDSENNFAGNTEDSRNEIREHIIGTEGDGRDISMPDADACETQEVEPMDWVKSIT